MKNKLFIVAFTVLLLLSFMLLYFNFTGIALSIMASITCFNIFQKVSLANKADQSANRLKEYGDIEYRDPFSVSYIPVISLRGNVFTVYLKDADGQIDSFIKA